MLNNTRFTFVAAQNVYDEIAKKPTNILLKAYEKDGFVWDDNDIYYFDKYDMPITDDFFNYCVGRENGGK
ncbi:MAG: hypothetical protein IKV89_00990 [Clostridia bacterium]|nr:hypothetical protein [Clostridia bacterium]